MSSQDISTKFIEFARTLSETVSQDAGMEELCDIFVSDFCRLFDAERVFLLFINDDGRLYLKRFWSADFAFKAPRVSLHGAGDQVGGSAPPQLPSMPMNETPLAALFANGNLKRVSLKDEISFLKTILPGGMESHLKAIGELHFSPLVAEKKVKGVVAFQVIGNIEADPKFDYVSSFCNWLAVTIDYAWHLERLQNFNLELEKKIEQRTRELKATQIHLIQQEKMAGLGQLTAGIAHEINNPLAFVMNNIALVKDDLLSASILADLEAAKSVGLPQGPEEFQRKTKTVQRLAGLSSFRKDLAEWRNEVEQLATPQEKQALLDQFLDYVKQALRATGPAQAERLNKDLNFIEDALEGLERTKKIVLDLRNFSRLDEAEFQFASIDDGIKNTLNIIKHLAKEKDITLSTNLRVMSLIPCYPSKLNQVFMNLIVNAIQASHQGGEVRISSLEDETQIRVTVEDFGSGIPPENLNKIFDPFFTTKPIGQGTGLGLSLSYQIIEDHKGSIGVESALGRGSKFSVKIPFSERKAIK